MSKQCCSVVSTPVVVARNVMDSPCKVKLNEINIILAFDSVDRGMMIIMSMVLESYGIFHAKHYIMEQFYVA